LNIGRLRTFSTGFVHVAWLRINNGYVPNSLKHVVFIVELKFVLCEVGTEFSV
jgi:hypothetical protein